MLIKNYIDQQTFERINIDFTEEFMNACAADLFANIKYEDNDEAQKQFRSKAFAIFMSSVKCMYTKGSHMNDMFEKVMTEEAPLTSVFKDG